MSEPLEQKRGRKWKFALPLLALWILWLLAEPLSRTFLIERMQEALAIELTLDEYELGGTFSDLSIGGLSVRDLDSNEVLSVDSLKLHANPWVGLEQELAVELVLAGMKLTVWQSEDGEWNLAGLPREKVDDGEDGADGSETSPGEEGESKRRQVRVTLDLRDSTIVMLEGAPVEGQSDEVWRGDANFVVEVLVASNGSLEFDLAELMVRTPFLKAQAGGLVEWEGQDSSELVLLDGFSGLVSFSPNELSELMAFELPADFAPDARESVSFKLNGALQSREWPSVLDHLQGELGLGIAGCTYEGFSLDGVFNASLRPNRIPFSGEFESNGGILALKGDLIPNAPNASPEEPAMTATLIAEGVRAGEEAARLFAYIHPAFALVDDLEGSTVDGLIDGQMELAWEAPIPWEQMFAGEEPVGLAPLTGRGELAVNQVVIDGSDLLQKLREELDDDAEGELRLRQLSFALRDERLTYENPWTWTIGKTETSFEGSVGLDQTLDMSWNMPVTAALVKRYRFLRKLEGQMLAVPIRGTSNAPIVEYESLIGNLGESLLSDILPGLSGADSAQDESPEALFRRANELWDAEQFTEAAAIYARIRAEHKVSVVYALNRKRIKKRAKYQE